MNQPIFHPETLRILNFWFGEKAFTDPQYREQWFSKDAAFDRTLASQFLPLYQRGVAGELESWRSTPESALAYTLLFDQFPRNMFRGTANAYATDGKALSCAKAAVAAGLDSQLPPLLRVFFYLPFEHSEKLADQRYSLKLFDRLVQYPGMESFIDYARRHAEVVKRFGRFPHRNAVLGRPNTAEEEAFLQQPGSSF